MKKSIKQKKKAVKMLVKNLIVVLALAVIAFVGVFSWFSHTVTADASGMTASTDVTESLEYYIMPPSDQSQYSTINTRLANNLLLNNGYATKWNTGQLTFDFSDQEFKFMEGLFLSEVTSDGSVFKIPKLLQDGNVAYVDTTQNLDNAVANENYMSFDMYFRCKNQCDIILKYDSVIEPLNAVNFNEEHDIDASDSANDSSVKPAAIGAVRMSVLNLESNNTRELTWVPGPNVWFDGINEHLYTGLSASGTGNYSYSNKGGVYYTGSALDYRNDSTTDHAFYNALGVRTVWSNGTYNVVASTNGNYTLGTSAGDDIPVVTLSNHDTDNDYYYGRIRINLWIEGEDAEARLKMVNGKFNMALKFDIASSSGN